MSYNKINVSYKETGMFSKTFTDYLDGASHLKPFYEYAPSVSAVGEVMKNMGKYRYSRKLLSSTIKDYYNRNAPVMASDATLKNIQKLEDTNCFTVTTGHQLCIFTGPLYFIFKIITVINLAEKLNKEYPSNHFVPVYWMASEDHDFAEINHANLYGKNVEWNYTNIGGPAGRLPLDSFSSIIESLFAIMGEGENTKELKQLILDSYSQEKTLAQATFSFVNALFGKYGLVILEPDNKELKHIFVPVINDELVNGNSFKLVSETNQRLIQAGVEPQVHAREINLFYINENGRNRIEKKDGRWSAVNGQSQRDPFGWSVNTANEIKNEVESSPESFSPNVILRPVYQQCILPNVAYVGGPAEIAYWLQLKSIFDFYKVPFPILMPRNCALLIKNAVVQKLDKLNISTTDLFKDTETLIKELIARSSGGLPDMEDEGKKLKEIYSALGEKVKEIDPTLVSFTEAELQKQYNALKTLETKLMRVKKQKEETSVTQIRKIKDYLFPEGVLQERTENFIPFYLLQSGVFFDSLKENFDPFEFYFKVLTEV
jgi:bacillithiol synthase